MKLAEEYYQYLHNIHDRDVLSIAMDYTEWLESELEMEWEVNGYPYQNIEK